MTAYRKTVLGLGILFFVINMAYLQRVPGLMGDEASEGQNVYELLERKGVTIQGERSYIGPLMDYVRVPFIAIFGYTALALRVPMLVASLITFLMAASVFRKWFGEELSLFPLALTFFSLPYLAEQRMGWAITLLPFFFFLIIWLAQREWAYKWVFVGLAAGGGLHNHILFAPTLAALVVAGPVAALHPHTVLDKLRALWGAPGVATRFLLVPLVLIISFWAGFSTQFIVLQLFPEDQGDPGAVAEQMSERIDAFPSLVPAILSGSSFVARYTGVEFAPVAAQGIAALVSLFAALGVILNWRNKIVWAWVVGLLVHLGVLLYMIDRFSLRYFVIFVLGVYVLAGLGIGGIVVRCARLLPKYPWFIAMKAVGLAVIMVILWVSLVLVPFLATGGSLAAFSLGNRTDTAAALVDVRPLLECVRGAGSVSSENVHIYNRLLYLSHEYSDLTVVPETHVSEASQVVHYRDQSTGFQPGEGELCPALTHFVVTPARPK